ncbi:4-hydroxybenzoate octaprenyltransferase [Candidatus Albibeggiatoa sp. nov. NOAA]|uniref:4-hydroxybenzoate octaprenyltransferase n=1 Tax=Candidatus Albibeggiatoa sp. nov. NOAA TaxID=3162724 RepID=UPI0032F72047|nr:4-hydroxybenzoate octaprenyltransferase [Thiotrichaceae bacterium]
MTYSTYLTDRLYQYALLTRLHRPIGIYLLLWPTLWAVWISSAGQPNWLIATVFVAGVVLMRSAGCVINDYADRHIDPHVSRTKLRPIANGDVSSKEALMLFVVLCLIAFGLVLLLNLLTIQLSFIALLLAAIYPFMKRYTHLPQVFLGAAFGWAIPMAFAAELNTVPMVAWWLFTINVLWVVVYDTMYAMVDREDDLKIGVKSTAILFGQADKVVIAGLQILVIALLIVLGLQLQFNWVYYVGLIAATLFALYQQWLIKDREPALCFKAFLNNHWFGLVIFMGIVLQYFLAQYV